MVAAEVNDGLPGYAFLAGFGFRGIHRPVVHNTDVCTVRFGDEALLVQHQRRVGSGVIGLDLGQDGLHEVCIMDFRVEAVRRKAAHRAGHQFDPEFIVHRRLVLREDVRVEPDWLSRGSMPEVIFHLA